MLDIVISSRRVYFIEYIKSLPTIWSNGVQRNVYNALVCYQSVSFPPKKEYVYYIVSFVYKQQVNDVVKCVDSIKEHKTIVGRSSILADTINYSLEVRDSSSLGCPCNNFLCNSFANEENNKTSNYRSSKRYTLIYQLNSPKHTAVLKEDQRPPIIIKPTKDRLQNTSNQIEDLKTKPFYSRLRAKEQKIQS